jgi:uncharacterized membrane protein
MQKTILRNIGLIALLAVLYVLIGNARSIQPNPFIPEAVLAVYMVVPVVAGILFGPWVGLGVGLLGTTLNAFSPVGSPFEFAAILPHGIMGLSAGFARRWVPTPFAACTIFVGHALNITAYLYLDLLESSILSDQQLWYGLLYETLVDIVTIYVLVTVFRIVFPRSLRL